MGELAALLERFRRTFRGLFVEDERAGARH
jgi:hypothetical protein